MIGWKVSSLTIDVASIRYRALLPSILLNDIHHRSHVFSDPKAIPFDTLDVLIFVKCLTTENITLAQEAFEKGITIILDLCDNVFLDGYVSSTLPEDEKPRAVFKKMASYASAIVTPSAELAEVIKKNIESSASIHVIPDGIETETSLNYMRRHLKWHVLHQHSGESKPITLPYFHILTEYFYLKFKNFCKPYCHFFKKIIHPKNKAIILWFGNYGNSISAFGLASLLKIQKELEQISQEFDVELVVISNNADQYNQLIKPIKINSRYIEWDSSITHKLLRFSSLVVIPNIADDFTLCKSANRTIMALNAGVPVVATATSALRDFSNCVFFDDFLQGMRTYLTDKRRVKRDISQFKKVTRKKFSNQKIKAQWLEILNKSKIDLIILLQLIQDLALMQPIIKEAKQQGIPLAIYCHEKLRLAPRLINFAAKENIFIKSISTDAGLSKFNFSFAKMLLSASETNLFGHRFSYRLTKAANKANLITATIQHGFENVGLNYDDPIHSIGQVSFASSVVYSWCPLNKLHRQIISETKNKCVPVGCPKSAPPAQILDIPTIKKAKSVISIFENLHWHRYSRKYREFFLETLAESAKHFPSFIFLIKPHDTGLWLTHNNCDLFKNVENLKIINPSSPQWQLITGQDLINHANMVITTPSTIALDAARCKKPTAVIGYDLKLSAYSPLPIIYNKTDWINFIADASDSKTNGSLTEKAAQFVEANIFPGDAAKNLIKDLKHRAKHFALNQQA